MLKDKLLHISTPMLIIQQRTEQTMQEMRTIPDYPHYSITPDGKVWSHQKKHFMTLRQKALNKSVNLGREVDGKKKYKGFLIPNLLRIVYPETVEEMRPIPNYPDYSLTPDGRLWSYKKSRFVKNSNDGTSFQLCRVVNGEQTKQSFLVRKLLLIVYPDSAHYPQDIKPIPGFPNYSITTDGRVFSTKQHRWVKTSVNRQTGYLTVCLDVDEGRFQYRNTRVNRLVALAYIPNPENKPVVDHINRKRLDNRVENLRWASYKENSNNKKVGRGSVYVCGEEDSCRKRWAFQWCVHKENHREYFMTKEEAEARRIIYYQLRCHIRRMRGLSY
jgi:hypothetical protein